MSENEKPRKGTSPESSERDLSGQDIQFFKNPGRVLERIKGRTDVNPFVLLLEYRQILKNHLLTHEEFLAEVDQDFALFLRQSNGAVQFYENAFGMLQRAGFLRGEVGVMCKAFLNAEDAPGKETMIAKLTSLINQALDSTFPPVGKSLN